MKNITKIAASLIMGGMALSANAADIYLVGDLTGYKELNEFAFEMDKDDPNIYTLDVNIPAGNFDFYFTFWSMAYLNPSSGKNAVVDFENGEYTDHLVLGMEPLNFVYENWNGGEVSFKIVVDNITGEGDLTITTGNEAGGVNEILDTSNKSIGVFNLKGVKVNEGDDINNLKNGVYIINGKKVMIKK